MRNTFIFTARGGKPDFGSTFNLISFEEVLKISEGKRFKVTREESKRSLSQNNFYWLYLGIIEQETGNGSSDLHEYFKRKHLPPKFIKVLGQEIKIPKSTTELSKLEFGDYMDKISAESGVPIPNPEDAGFYK